MTGESYRKWTLALSAAGTLFSGYLSGVRLSTRVCAFNEPCPLFLGIPACYIGFAMFLTLFVISLYSLVKKPPVLAPARANLTVAALGALFAAWITVPEIAGWIRDGVTLYGLGLPTCAYGLVFFVVILVLSYKTVATPAATAS